MQWKEFSTWSPASILVALGYGPMDALHLACAEPAAVDVLLTPDDRFLRRAMRRLGNPIVQVANPVEWLREMEPWFSRKLSSRGTTSNSVNRLWRCSPVNSAWRGSRDTSACTMPGSGDYTRDRHQWLGHLSLDDLMEKVGQREQ